MLLVDAATVQNAVASASIASSPTSDFALALVSALSDFDVVAASLKNKLYNLGLILIDNTQSQFPVAVSSPSSLSSKALTVRRSNPFPTAFTIANKQPFGRIFGAKFQ